MPFNFDRLVTEYYQDTQDQKYPRYKAWDIIWDYVQSKDEWGDLISDRNIENTALHLGFYLANWGMFRGSSGLLNTNLNFIKDFLYHLFNKIPIQFWDISFYDFDPSNPKNHKRSSELFDNALYTIEEFEPNLVTWTETLKTKILLGIWGQCPAFDTYYQKGLSLLLNESPNYRVEPKRKINSKSLTCLYTLHQSHKWLLDGYVTSYGKNAYPPGKIIDMAFFQHGLNNS